MRVGIANIWNSTSVLRWAAMWPVPVGVVKVKLFHADSTRWGRVSETY